jgi:acyl carrier protein
MDKIIEILSEINGDVDFRTADKIIDDELIDSIDFTSLVSELEDTFDVEIGMDEIIPDNFNTVQAIWNMITRLQEQ